MALQAKLKENLVRHLSFPMCCPFNFSYAIVLLSFFPCLSTRVISHVPIVVSFTPFDWM